MTLPLTGQVRLRQRRRSMQAWVSSLVRQGESPAAADVQRRRPDLSSSKRKSFRIPVFFVQAHRSLASGETSYVVEVGGVTAASVPVPEQQQAVESARISGSATQRGGDTKRRSWEDHPAPTPVFKRGYWLFGLLQGSTTEPSSCSVARPRRRGGHLDSR
jgi:hypothetical protein